MSSSKVPCCTTTPPSSTMIRSARLMVDKRWATTIRVIRRSSMERTMSSWVMLSSALVDSSSTSMRGRPASARAIRIRCRSPPDSDVPPSTTGVSRPRAMPRMSSPMAASSSASQTSALESRRPMVMLSRIVPGSRALDCSTQPICRRTAGRLSAARSLPSMEMVPDSMSSRPNRTRMRVDLPQPDAPTMATCSPGLTSKVTPESTRDSWPA